MNAQTFWERRYGPVERKVRKLIVRPSPKRDAVLAHLTDQWTTVPDLARAAGCAPSYVKHLIYPLWKAEQLDRGYRRLPQRPIQAVYRRRKDGDLHADYRERLIAVDRARRDYRSRNR